MTLGGTTSARTFSFAFHNLKGETGANGCNRLVGGYGIVWASSKTAYTYFRIDTASTPRYITAA